MTSHSSLTRRAGVADDRAVLAASGHLTDRDRYLVRMVAEHRVLTTDQLCALGFGNIITARHRLGVLVKIGVLRRFRPRREVGSAPWHYLLGPVGAALLGAEDRDERRWLPQVRTDRQLALERSQRLAHMTGANWFFVSLAAHARTGGGKLRMWLGEAGAGEYYKSQLWSHDRDDALPNPDGLGTWAEHGREVTFVLEYDAGTENMSRLAAKLESYGTLAEGLAKIEQICPPLLCFPAPRREQAARRALADCQDAAAMRIATTALDPQVTCPAGAVWLPLRGATSSPPTCCARSAPRNPGDGPMTSPPAPAPQGCVWPSISATASPGVSASASDTPGETPTDGPHHRRSASDQAQGRCPRLMAATMPLTHMEGGAQR